MIIEPATGSGSMVLDPNNDGYISSSNIGFITDDELESEIPFIPFIFPGLEPNSDLNNAPNCGFTDFVDKGNKDPGQKYLSASGKWIFRLRMGSVSPNAKSYSILIDTDGKFGNTGINADPNYSLNNPGFEIEIVLATKFGVFVYDVNTPNCSPVISYAGTTNYQKSIALTADCSDPDYFLDFFVNFSDLATQFGVTTSTLMRYAIVDNTAANKSTICNPNSASDVAGVGNCPNLATCFATIINYQGYCAPNQTLCLSRSDCPVILGSISPSATSVSGTSTEGNGTVIKLYKNTAFTASTTVSAGTWTISGLSPSLAASDVIDITATGSGEYESISDCNTQTVVACSGTVISAPVVNNATGKNFCGSGTVGYNVRVNYPDGSLFTANPVISSYLPVPLGGNWVWKCTGNTGGCNSGSGVDCIAEGGYMLYQADANGCKSYPAFACVSIGGGYSPITSITPTLVSGSVISGATSVAVNVVLSAIPSPQSGYVYLFLNGAYYGVSSSISSSGTVAVSCAALPGCSTLSAMFIQASSGSGDHDCFSAGSNSVSILGGSTSVPQISGSFCTIANITSVSGISSEANGTAIQLYVNGVASGSAVSVNSGTWSVTSGISIAPGSTITATALAPCKTISAASSAVLIQSQSSAGTLSISTSPIVEQASSISGVGTNGSVIQLYIDSYPVASTVVVSGGTWSVSGIASYELYTGGVVSAAASVGSGCPSPTVSGGFVICIPPTTSLAVTPSSVAFCTNTGVATVTLSNSQSLVVYQLTLSNGTTTTGSSILGNGGNIVLSSGTLSASTTLKVKSIKMPPSACQVLQTNTVPVLFSGPTPSLSVTSSHSNICSGNIATITIANTQTVFNYQLRNNSNNTIIGSSLAGTGGNLTFTTGVITSTTSYNVFATGTGTNSCTGTLSSIVTISTSPAPTVGIANNTGSTQITCFTPSISLTASGGGTYSWSPGLGSSASVTISSLGNYSVTVTSTNGCSSTSTFALTGNTTAPTLLITNNTGSSQLTCTTPSISLTASGASTYSWTSGLGAFANATPTVGGNYSVTGTGTNGCSSSTSITISQNTVSPSLSISNNSGTTQLTCFTTSISLTASGGNTYFWTGGLGTSSNATITGQGNYSVIATGTNGCSSTSTIAITQNTTTPTLTVVATGSALCIGQSVTLTVSGASSFTWLPGSSTGSIFVVSPTTAVVYTVTGTNGICISSATKSISINNCPTAINDATITPLGIPVVANAATNDVNASGGTFSIISQPSGGTVAINSSSGQYTFTPAIAFTGVTTATYQLCNGAPVLCSTANITFTVFPTLLANPDIINTSPSVTATGSLLSNDAGITPTLGGIYSVSVTQPAASTGTITLNPSTGQYTFVPNPSFAGSVVTTYTICNTAVNPQQCSNTSITINVSSNPLPVNDFTNTIINTPIAGNAASNDGGTTGGTFSITGQPSGGTVTINPGSGQYTFTPAFSFTGVTTATYNLCNGAPITCSTAIITITVYPALAANPDIITTTPSVTVSGTLITNDSGIIPGGTYSSSITQPAPGVGTITINPATGQYTFTPSPSYTGTASTTYTLCNTAINPIVCSSASILIQAGSSPTAVNDAINTVINTPVSASAASNDSGALPALNPTFTASQPAPGTGTLTMNAFTGVYTYSPATGFTGTASATYTLCNILSPCSSATITFTVYPTIVTNPDVISTTPSVTTTGTLVANDTGVLLSGTLTANYTVTATALNASVGVLSVNGTNGQYTFVPNPAFAGSVQATYTVCNTSVNPTICSSNTIVIYVYPVPGPVNDATTTVIGVTVSGNASSNDTGTLLATYTITGQPSGGTISIVPNTGVYTFSPSPTFTGVTTATYQLCNGASTSCSTAVITITVHPLIVANNDVINTSPTSSVTGNLLTNDAGITSTIGATYSVTVIQPSPSSGTLILNATTGQYTFIPNPTFAGTVQTNYQVCNTAINPQQCSTATIIINVFPNPLPVNDATITLINITVSGNAAANDSGTTGGTFSITAQPSGGTLTINSASGQYTFVPSPTFTGVTTATYNLCNGAPVTCSTAIITITVFPNLVANDDPIVTSPTITVSGSLLGNDGGIIPGGTYSVTISPLSLGTGTINVNPATGQYTFTPNPAFTGSVVTTYTVCNTIFNPVVCSTASIIIFVGDAPIAVNDATVTLINTSVSDDVSTNDSNLANALFTFGNPVTGTLTGNPATGQFTFTPPAGFTGTTSATYTLCNIVSPPCATATIIFTVYPALIAVNDYTTTGTGNPVSGSLTLNDSGIVSGGSYSVFVSQPPLNSGTIMVNPATGQYTYTPPSGFTGTVITSYTLCQYSGTVQLQCSTASITIIIGSRPSIGLAKALIGTIYNNDGTLTQTYKLVVKNMGNLALTNIALSDNLSATYPSPSSFTVLNPPSVINPTTSLISVDNTYSGTATASLMTLPLSSSLAIGKADSILFTVRVNPNGFSGTYQNSANVVAIGSGITVNDESVNGLDPDPDNDGDPTNNGLPTTFSFSIVKIGVAKSFSLIENSGSCSTGSFKFTVKNYGTSPIYNVSLIDNLDNTFAFPTKYSVVSAPVSIKSLLLPNANFAGNGNNTNLVLSTSSLAAGAFDTIVMRIKYCFNGQASFSNMAVASANSIQDGGFTGSDSSSNGNNPDPDGDGDPNEKSPTIFSSFAELFIPEGFSPNNDYVNDLLVIRGIENYPDNELNIINRWGTIVYKKKIYDNTWDGTSNQGIYFGNNQLPEGTYFYIIDLGDGSNPVKGYIYLNRSQK